MEAGTCIMSTAALASGSGLTVAAWETDGQVEWEAISPAASAQNPGPKVKAGRKHPTVAVNDKHEILLAWAEGTGWNKGGTLHWHLCAPSGMPVAGSEGQARGLGVWGSPAAFAARNGDFVILY